MFSWFFGNKNKAHKFYDQALKDYENDNLDSALYCLNEAVRLETKIGHDAKFHALKGEINYKQNNKEDALNNYKMAISLNPQKGLYYAEIAQIYCDLKDYTNALLNVKKAIKLEPQNAKTYKIFMRDIEKENNLNIAEEYYRKGRTYLENGNNDKAIECFEQAKDLNPNKDNYYWCGMAKYCNKQYKKAIKEFSYAIDIKPCAKYYYMRGHSKFLDNKYQESIEDFSVGIDLNPKEIYKYYKLRADAKLRLGNYSGANSDYKKALKNNPSQKDYNEIIKILDNIQQEIIKDKIQTYNNQGQNYLSINMPESALEEFNKAIKLQPQNPYLYLNRAYALFLLNSYDKCIDDCLVGIKNCPENVAAYYKLLANAEKKTGNIDGAKLNYKKALESNPTPKDYNEITNILEELENNSNNPHESNEQEQNNLSEEGQTIIEKIPITAEDYYNKGETCLNEENYKEAIEYFENAKKLDPDDPDYHFECGYAKYMNDQNEEAIEDFNQGINLNPNIYEYYEFKAYAEEEVGYYTEAIVDYEKVLELNPSKETSNKIKEYLHEIKIKLAIACFEDGRTYFNEGKYEQAVECFKESIKFDKNNIDYQYWFGYAKYKNNNFNDAIKILNYCINNNPTNISSFYYLRGKVKKEIKDYEGAIEDYKRSLKKTSDIIQQEEINQSIEELNYEQAELYIQRGEKLQQYSHEDAIIWFEKAIKLDPDNPDYYDRCGNAYYEINKYKKAIECYDNAINIFLVPGCFYRRALAKYRLGDYDGTIKDCETQLELDDTDYYDCYDLIDDAKRDKKENRQKLCKEKPNKNELSKTSAEYLYQKTKELYESKNFNKALEKINEAIELNNTDSRYHKLRVDIKKSLDDQQIKISNNDELYKSCDQRDIYDETPDKSFLVNAGPGTGKTYTLIQKIKHLLNYEDIEEENILVLSHTNAAVNEIKNRLKNISKDTNINVNKINIRTICSFVKYAHSKIDEEYNKNKDNKDKKYYVYKATENGFTEANKDLINNRLQSYSFKQLLKEKLNIKYFIVDEIQDSVDTVGNIILKLVETCVDAEIPFALFGDKCQAIFDFVETMPSDTFYEKIEKIIRKTDNLNFVSLEKNMRQQDGLDYLKGDLKEYRQAIFNDDIEGAKECLKFIKNKTPDKLLLDNISKDYTHCVLTHSNNRALFIASVLRGEGIPAFVRVQENGIQFEYHEWIGKILCEDDYSHLNLDLFKKLVLERNVNLPTNYNGYEEDIDKETHIRTFYEYLNTEILENKPIYKISKRELLDKLYYEYTCDTIFKDENKSNIEVSTIHKAKGREFDCVHIESKCCTFRLDQLNTYKSMYVALTRPRKSIDFTEFSSVPWWLHKNETYYTTKKTDKKKLNKYRILYKNIDLNSFEKHQEEIFDVKLNDKITLIRQNDNWNIECKDKIIGQMISIYDPYKYKQKMKKITGLYVDGIWSVFDKNKDTGEIKVWNVVSFCGFGDVKYE